VLYSGVACITDLMVKEGLINLDFADVRSVMREMGKAMMGTGEASGERRAIEAAEAAIANPLLDETTMKGARGLLISITGGKDLTLFEVDEAATRIREEVDPDANIILGATFEEALEGVIRVSVVATGIEAEAVDAATDQRLAELKTRLRGMPAPVAAQSAVHAVTQAVAQPAPAYAPAARPAAAVPQQARMHESGITIAPLDPGQMSYGHAEIEPDHHPVRDEPEMPGDTHFIPPEPEAPARIPRVEDFPPVVQRQIEAKQRGQRPDHEDRGPMSLLRRLAGVGLGRREEEPAQREPQLKRPLQRTPQRQLPPQPRVAQPAPRAQPKQEGLYKPRQGELDQHGRPLPAANRAQADDELEIPAFLRRQAN
jgi:cell division protein FtsZ